MSGDTPSQTTAMQSAGQHMERTGSHVKASETHAPRRRPDWTGRAHVAEAQVLELTLAGRDLVRSVLSTSELFRDHPKAQQVAMMRGYALRLQSLVEYTEARNGQS
jgi:hypothetical protein